MLPVDTRKNTFIKSIVCPARGFADFLNRVSTVGKCIKAHHLIKFRIIQSSGSQLRETLPSKGHLAASGDFLVVPARG